MRLLQLYKIPAALLLIMALPYSGIAAGPPVPSELNNPLAITLLIVIVGLLIAIGGLGYVVITAAQVYLQRYKEARDAAAQKDASVLPKVAGMVLLCLLGSAVYAQDAASGETAVEQVVTSIGGLSKMSFYTLVSVIALELLVLFILLFNLKVLLAKEKRMGATATAEEPEVAAVPKEADIALDHDYDGIKELDNKLPPWWLYGFYITIFFAVIYLWRYHVSHSAPLSKEELAISLEKAEVEKAAYLAHAANNVDENTVTLLTDAASLEGGKKIFTSVCAACHAADGGGGVGPNLTDDYWLHGGGVKDVFKTIKYGWPEKGMKSWKDDFSPVQLAQLASFVKSLKGTKPATAKEPQGELYKETPAGAQEPAKDSAVVSKN